MVSIRRLFGRGGDEDADQHEGAEARGADIAMTQPKENTPVDQSPAAPKALPNESPPGDTAPDWVAPPALTDLEPGPDQVSDSAEVTSPAASTHGAPPAPVNAETPAHPAPAPVEPATLAAQPAPPAPDSDTARDAGADTPDSAPLVTPQFLDPALVHDSEPDGAPADVPQPEHSTPPPGEAPQGGGTTPLPADPNSSWLVAGSKVANRYTIVRELTVESATDVLGSPPPISNAMLFAVDDRMGYERCWSCGSTNNDQHKRFCVDCGAPQHREAVLARTLTSTGLAGEFAEGGFFYHIVSPRKQFGSAGVSLEVGAFSAEGPHHPNEDSYWSGLAGGCYDSHAETIGVIVLADGMGGYAPGSGLISKSIVTTVGRGVFDLLNSDPNLTKDEASLEAIVHGAIANANGKVLEEIKLHGDMGATLVVAIIFGQTAFVANIGDSRAYYVSSSGTVEQITRDQSLVEQQVAMGKLSPDAIYTAVGNNVILHAVGEDGVEDVMDWYTQPLEPGSHLMLCSDGYWKTMQHAVWDVGAAAAESTLRGLARTMVENALANNTDDNTTVVLVGID
jgi:serine/threonine protein phosphatase PrpC